MKRLLSCIPAVLLLLFSFILITPPALAAGTAKDQACTAVNSFQGESGDNCKSTVGLTIPGLIHLLLQMLTVVAGVIAVIMLIVAGFNYITSDGDATKISHAKSTLIYAIVGIVVVAFAQFIVKFVLAKAT